MFTVAVFASVDNAIAARDRLDLGSFTDILDGRHLLTAYAKEDMLLTRVTNSFHVPGLYHFPDFLSVEEESVIVNWVNTMRDTFELVKARYVVYYISHKLIFIV